MTGERLPAQSGRFELTQALGNRPPEAEGPAGKKDGGHGGHSGLVGGYAEERQG